MVKYDKIVLVIVMFVIGGVFLFYADIFTNEIKYLKGELRYFYSGSNPQCYHKLDAYLCERLKRLCELQLKLTTLLYTVFTTIGWILIISGIIYSALGMKTNEERLQGIEKANN